MANIKTLSIQNIHPTKNNTPPTQPHMHFASGFNAHKLIWIFTLGSVLGFLVETIWRLCSKGQWEVRSSLVWGPFNILYGVGAVVLFLILRKVDRRKKVQIAVWGMVIGTVVEYLLALAQEAVFGTASWDYSHLPLNIGGKVCLYFSLAWGAISLVWAFVVQPLMENIMSKFSDQKGRRLAIALAIFLAINMTISALAVMRWQMRLHGTATMTPIGALLDQCFPDGFMRIIYANMSVIQS